MSKSFLLLCLLASALRSVSQPSNQPNLNVDKHLSLKQQINIAREARDYEAMAGLLGEWVMQHPSDTANWFQYAAALKNERRYEEAEQAFKTVVQLDPGYTQAYVYLFLLMHQLDRQEEANSYLASAERTGTLDKHQYMGMGFTLYSLNKHKEGVPFFEKVVEEDPSSGNLYNLACGYARSGDPEKAVSALERAIQAGFNSREQMESDPDLNALRSNERFVSLINKLPAKATPQEKNE